MTSAANHCIFASVEFFSHVKFDPLTRYWRTVFELYMNGKTRAVRPLNRRELKLTSSFRRRSQENATRRRTASLFVITTFSVHLGCIQSTETGQPNISSRWENLYGVQNHSFLNAIFLFEKNSIKIFTGLAAFCNNANTNATLIKMAASARLEISCIFSFPSISALLLIQLHAESFLLDCEMNRYSLQARTDADAERGKLIFASFSIKISISTIAKGAGNIFFVRST